jgi:ABC-type branched-subunit amino acid transport system substrate-binding protein
MFVNPGRGVHRAAFAVRRRAVAVGLVSLALALSACRSTGNLGIESQEGFSQTPSALSTPNGEVIGTGPVRIALLLPRTAPGNAAAVATEVRNGAALAMQDFGRDAIELVVKDTTGQASGAQSAATEAVREGSLAILGPVFAANVSAASAIALPSGRTMVAFSTDTSVARRGIYLLSYTPQDDTRRIIRYALSQGKRSMLAFLPSNAEGTLRESVLRQEVGAVGSNLRILKYDRSTDSIETAVQQAGGIVAGFDAVYIPEGNEIPNAILQAMRRQGVDLVGKQILGSGAWESVKLDEAHLENAVYPGRDLSNFEEFAARYQQANGARPNVWAGLGYDAVTLVTDLVTRMGPEEAFRPGAIENPRGFSGVNGIFRLRSNGTAERGLAIYRISGGRRELLVPAPTSFSQAF